MFHKIIKVDQEGSVVSQCTILLALSLLCSLFGVLGYRPPVVSNPIPELIPSEPTIRSIFDICSQYNIDTIHKQLITRSPYRAEEEIGIIFEEEYEACALFYAIEPIGRYYITAYNHEETGGKRTASGTICHEGNITTCAADVWGGYFKFGDYIEVDGRIFRVEDTGSAVKKKHIDLYFASYKDMAKYGSNYQTIYRVTFPFGKPQDNY